MPPEQPGDLYQRRLGARRKAEGAFFTPAPLTERVVRRTLEPWLTAIDPQRLPRIFDPACGAGWFLFAAWRVVHEALLGWYRSHQPGALTDGQLPVGVRRRLLSRFYGIDRDPIAVVLAQRGLRQLSGLTGSISGIKVGDSLSEAWPEAEVIIGNPPYVRNRLQDEAQREGVDLYVRFVEKALRGLAPGGRAGLVVSNRLLTARYAGPLRNTLASGRHIVAVEDLAGAQLFPGASAYVCLLWLSSDPTLVAEFTRADAHAWVSAATLGADPWPVSVGRGAPLQARLSRLPTLGEAASLFVGVQTSADKVYHLGGSAQVESDACRPLLTGRDLRPYMPPLPSQRILFPYRTVLGRAELLPWEELDARWPLAARWLHAHRPELEGREGGRFADATWYRFGRAQNLALQAGPKLCVPRLVRRLCATLDGGEAVLDNADVLGVRGHGEWSLSALLGLFNSRLWGWYLSRTAAPFRSGYLSANRQFVERLPMPDSRYILPLETAVAAVQAGQRPEVVDQVLEEAFALSSDEREVVAASTL